MWLTFIWKQNKASDREEKMQVMYDGRWGEKRLLVSFAWGEFLIKLVVLDNDLADISW